MTRQKKTRSLKRIHKVKTGNVKKLKRALGNDRQTGKRVKNKTKSAYEKYLEQNPEAREKQTQKPTQVSPYAESASASSKEKNSKDKKGADSKEKSTDLYDEFERSNQGGEDIF